MSAIMPRASVEQIVAARNATLSKFEEAFASISDAEQVLSDAHALWDVACGGNSGSKDGSAERGFWSNLSLPDYDRFLKEAERLVDLSVWEHIIRVTTLRRLMDRQAREELDAQLYRGSKSSRRNFSTMPATGDEDEADGFPPITVENIHATLERFAAEADMIWKRGIANAFAGLDRRFRSHDGFKVGSRMIIERLCDDTGWLRYSGYKQEEIHDIERAFAVLDERFHSSSSGIIEQVRVERQGYGARQSRHCGDYFEIRIYKNGNAHLWFRRDDLVQKVNKILAEYYGEVIADGMTQDEDPLSKVKTSPAKRHGFFPSPSDVCDHVFGQAPISSHFRKRVLEPSAGTGALARRAVMKGQDVTCVEIQNSLANQLKVESIYASVHHANFLDLTPSHLGKFDVVIMNPPFDRERDIDHVVHALKFLKPGGTLVSVMSAGTEFRETKKAIAFRALVDKHRGRSYDLPAGSFSSVGTNVNTIIVTMTPKEIL